jgi:protein-tyrosine phosphatase
LPTILFVCTYNQFRSPVAESYLRHKLESDGNLKDWRVLSAGTWATANALLLIKTIRLASGLELNLSSHQSSEVNEKTLDKVDLVMVMERGQKEAMVIEFPKHRNKIILLTELIGETSSISEPLSSSAEDLNAKASEIAQVIDKGFKRLVKLVTRKST